MSGPATRDPCVRVRDVAHRYGRRPSLDGINFEVEPGEIFGLLGPNGSGKTTLFKILATLLAPARGMAEVFGLDVTRQMRAIRRRIGVAFQAPALDGKLTARENLDHQGWLFGLRGAGLRRRVDMLLERFALGGRAGSRVDQLSGGLRRRVDLARAMLHEPELLLLDEPTAGLDPGARRAFWEALETVRSSSGVTVMVTTHVMSDAEHCRRLGILSRGKLCALDTPDRLRSAVGGDVIELRGRDPQALRGSVHALTGSDPQVLGGSVRIEQPNGHEMIPKLVEALAGQLDSVSLSKPTLEDAYIHVTGHRFSTEDTKDDSRADVSAPAANTEIGA